MNSFLAIVDLTNLFLWKLQVVELRDKEELTGITEEGVFEAMITSGNLSSLTEKEFEEKVYHCGSCNRSFGQK